MEDGRSRIAILYSLSSILGQSALRRWSRAPAAGTRKMQLQIIAFGVEHINRVAAVALDGAMKFAQRFGGLERVAVIFPRHVERLMKNAIFIQRVALDWLGPFEEHDVIVAAAETVELLRHPVNRERVRIVGIAADPAEIFHAENVGVKI